MASKKLDEKDQAIGIRIRRCRVAKRMNQAMVARKLKLERETVCAIENGHRKIKVTELLQICRVIEADPLQVMGVEFSKITGRWEDIDEAEGRSRRNGATHPDESNNEFFGW